MVFSNILMIKIIFLFNIIYEGEIIFIFCEGEEYIMNCCMIFNLKLLEIRKWM